MIAGVKLYKTSNHQHGPFVLDGENDSSMAVALDDAYRKTIEDAESTGLYRFP